MLSHGWDFLFGLPVVEDDCPLISSKSQGGVCVRPLQPAGFGFGSIGFNLFQSIGCEGGPQGDKIEIFLEDGQVLVFLVPVECEDPALGGESDLLDSFASFVEYVDESVVGSHSNVGGVSAPLKNDWGIAVCLRAELEDAL